MQATQTRTILIAESDLELCTYLRVTVQALGYSVETTPNGGGTIALLRSRRKEIDAVLLDMGMLDRPGLDVLSEIRECRPTVPVIVIFGLASSDEIVSAMKIGASNVLCKPVTHEALHNAIDGVMEGGSPSCLPLSRVRPPVNGMFLGKSANIRKIQALAGRIGWSEAPVLIQGETGTGKEMIARELHARSPRCEMPFLKVNCAALPSELIESELFGYERGAFTGALQRKTGMFEDADGGTLLLDEIGDMDFRLQSKLLHVLQDGSFLRIGGKEVVNPNVRIMAATHCDLEQNIARRTFREDLYYRLNVISVQLPPLRDRKEDILELAGFLIRKHAIPGMAVPALTAELQSAMLTYHWPGNIRELENCIRKLLIIGDAETIARELQEKSNLAGTASNVGADQRVTECAVEHPGENRQHLESEAILSALNRTGWNRRQAAILLHVSYYALRSRMKKLGIGRALASTDSIGSSLARARGSIQ